MKRITTFEGRATLMVHKPGGEYRTTSIEGPGVEVAFERENPSLTIKEGARYRVTVDHLDGVEVNRSLIMKVENRESLTDAQLDEAIRFYTDLERSLRLLGERHHFSWNDVRQTLDMLEGFKTARVREADENRRCRSRKAL